MTAALIFPERAWSREELLRRAAACRQPAAAGQRIGLRAADAVDFVVGLLALVEDGADAVLLGYGDEARGDEGLDLAGLADGLGPAQVSAPAEPGPSGVTLLTSGTSGRPKLVRHDWTTLRGPVRPRRGVAPRTWLTGYPLSLYAGLQVLLQAWESQEALVLPGGRDPDHVARALARFQVTHLTGTATFLRQLVWFGDRALLAASPVEQITLGGEAVGQDVLDGLRQVFPRARLSQVYATSETGRVFAVHDGVQGFPATYLEQPPEPGVRLRVVEGVLEVQSPHRMRGYDARSGLEQPGAWYRTGDRVERQGDRWIFVGRTTDLIFVGGQKVQPLQVEAALRPTPGVADLRVYPLSNPLTGQLVALEVVLQPGSDEAQVRAALQERAAALPRHERPRRVQVVQQLQVNAAGKAQRGGGDERSGHPDQRG